MEDLVEGIELMRHGTRSYICSLECYFSLVACFLVELALLAPWSAVVRLQPPFRTPPNTITLHQPSPTGHRWLLHAE